VWHVKEPSLLKAMRVKHTSKFAAGNGDSRQIAEKLLKRVNKETHKYSS
jgi:hypothetical protein